MKRLKIAIDGPCASGKSTVAKILAEQLGYKLINTGAMYRAVGLMALENDIDPLDEQGVKSILRQVAIDFAGPASNQRTILNGRDITERIAEPDVAQAASSVSSLLPVRRELVARQQAMARAGGVVLEGRDIGTVVLKDAECKFFITASLGERARRRLKDYERLGIHRSLPEVQQELHSRDLNDMTREHSPLVKAEDAIEIDTTDLTIEQVINRLLGHIEENCRKPAGDRS
ncbi:MAG: (d)CMP kinase [Candidatus Coatesbacteria bacterium]|nr:MAG: (d)CMP kinase [Candidatus Coatesbacteria bacterium]